MDMSTTMERVCHHAYLGDQLLRILMENPCRAPQGEWNVRFHLDIVKYHRHGESRSSYQLSSSRKSG